MRGSINVKLLSVFIFVSDSDTGPAPFTKIALSGTDWPSTAQQPNSFLFSTDTEIYDYFQLTHKYMIISKLQDKL